MKVTLTRRVHDAMHHEGNIAVKGFVLQEGFCCVFKKRWMIVLSERRISRKVLIEVSEEVNKQEWLFVIYDLSKMLSDSLSYRVIVLCLS